MKRLLIAAALIPIITFILTRAGLFGLVLCLPVVGIGWAFYGFGRWHRRFHARMKRDGIRRRAPA